jgi:putative tryptophan/tyrosine transport system substrate-binding protein
VREKKKKAIFCLALCALLLALSFSAEAQQAKKIPRIGWLTVGSQSVLPERYEAFRAGLRELGYTEGQNILIVRKDAGEPHRLTDAAAELVRLKVEVIVTTGTTGALAAKQATSTIPIVMTTGDPVATGIITNLARPGGNITGLTNIASDLAGKRLELLKETFPKFTRLGVLWNPADPSSTGNLKETETVARALGIEVQSLQVRTSNDFETAFKAASTERVHALVILQNALINAREHGSWNWQQKIGYQPCSGNGHMWNLAVLCPMRQTPLICSGEPPATWTKF